MSLVNHSFTTQIASQDAHDAGARSEAASGRVGNESAMVRNLIRASVQSTHPIPGSTAIEACAVPTDSPRMQSAAMHLAQLRSLQRHGWAARLRWRGISVLCGADASPLHLPRRVLCMGKLQRVCSENLSRSVHREPFEICPTRALYAIEYFCSGCSSYAHVGDSAICSLAQNVCHVGGSGYPRAALRAPLIVQWFLVTNFPS